MIVKDCFFLVIYFFCLDDGVLITIWLIVSRYWSSEKTSWVNDIAKSSSRHLLENTLRTTLHKLSNNSLTLSRYRMISILFMSFDNHGGDANRFGIAILIFLHLLQKVLRLDVNPELVAVIWSNCSHQALRFL